MRKTITIFFFLLISMAGFSQDREVRVKDRSFVPDMQSITKVKRSSRKDKNGDLPALVTVFYPSKDSILFSGELVGEPFRSSPGECLVFLSGEAQSLVVTVGGCKPYTYKFPSHLGAGNAYRMDVEVVSTNRLRTLILPSVSWNSSQWSGGLMLALCNKNGGYIRAKTNMGFELNPPYTCDEKGFVNGVQAWFKNKEDGGEARKSRLAITAGYMRQIIDPLYLYIGGGWGTRVLAWEMYVDENTYDWARVSTKSFSGFEAEMGAVFRMGSFAISAGVQTNSFKYVEANVGIGVMF